MTLLVSFDSEVSQKSVPQYDANFGIGTLAARQLNLARSQVFGRLSRSPMASRHHNEPSRGTSQRQLRVGELIRHALAELLARGDVHDPVLEGHMITVPEVRLSPDLRLATVYVMPLGGRDQNEVLAALERNKKFLRGEIAHRVNLKFAPDLRFRIDERFDEAERIEKLLRTPQVQRDLDKKAGDSE